MVSPVSAALGKLAFTRPAYDEAASMYDGIVREVIASPKLAELLGGTSDAYCVNYARTPVDVLVERTMIQGWTGKDAAAIAQVEQAWTDNDLGLEAKDVHRRAYEYGDAYLIGWSDDELPGGVSVYAHDPTDVRVFYRPDRPREKSHAVHTWLEEGDRDPDTGNGLGEGYWRRVNLYYPDHLERYVSAVAAVDVQGNAVDFVSTGADGHGDDGWRDFDGDGDDSIIFYADQGMPDVVPVFHFRTARPYGRPEHADAFGPQRGINKLVVSMMGAVDFHILPQRYATTKSALDAGPANDPFAGTPQADPSTGDNGFDDLDSAPGGIWTLSGEDIEVGEFSAALMSNFLEPKNDLVDSMAAVTDLPLSRFRPQAGQAPSGESQRMTEIPLNKKTSDRFAQFGVTWREWASWVVAVNAMAETVDPLDVNVSWAPPETYSDAASWAAAEAQLRVGVPYEQVLRERGYSTELVATWSADRAAAAAAAPKPPRVPDQGGAATETEDSDVTA